MSELKPQIRITKTIADDKGNYRGKKENMKVRIDYYNDKGGLVKSEPLTFEEYVQIAGKNGKELVLVEDKLFNLSQNTKIVHEKRMTNDIPHHFDVIKLDNNGCVTTVRPLDFQEGFGFESTNGFTDAELLTAIISRHETLLREFPVGNDDIANSLTHLKTSLKIIQNRVIL